MLTFVNWFVVYRSVKCLYADCLFGSSTNFLHLLLLSFFPAILHAAVVLALLFLPFHFFCFGTIFAFIYLVILLWSCLDSWILLFHFFPFYPTALVFSMCIFCSYFFSFPPFFAHCKFFFWPILGGLQWDNWNFSRVRYAASHNVLLIVHYYFTGHVPTVSCYILQMYVTYPSENWQCIHGSNVSRKSKTQLHIYSPNLWNLLYMSQLFAQILNSIKKDSQYNWLVVIFTRAKVQLCGHNFFYIYNKWCTVQTIMYANIQ